MSDSLRIENLSRSLEMGDPANALERVSIQEMRQNGMTESQNGSGKTFSDVLRDSLNQVNQHQAQADLAIKELLAGRNKNLHETLLAVERADASLKLAMQVRNKVLDAYREIMRMQV